MGTRAENHNQALAEHLRMLRMNGGLTLQDLANSSGVSRATLSRIENSEVSPTAETLGRLASAFALPLSQLLTPLEQDFPPLVRRADQTIWLDRENGFSRRTLSPPSGRLKLEMIECEIAPNRRIAYDRPAFPGHEHHLVVMAGALTLTVDDIRHDLSAGDCRRYQLRGASIFETGEQPARYIIAMA
jgi:transcriptional regulator with XRE-family HTH domain